MGFLEQVKEYAYKQLDKYEEQDILFSTYDENIGKYLSRLRKLDHAIVLKIGFEP